MIDTLLLCGVTAGHLTPGKAVYHVIDDAISHHRMIQDSVRTAHGGALVVRCKNGRALLVHYRDGRVTTHRTLRPLRDEDGRNGWWDAPRRGNGYGLSYWVDRKNHVHYLVPVAP